MRIRDILLLLATLVLFAAVPCCAQIPAALGWYQIPSSTLQPVCSTQPGIHGTGGCSQVIAAWSGGTADTKRNRLIIWGGGHNDYYGNEVYALDLNSLTMKRILDAVPNPTTCVETEPNGTPNGRHTYYDLAYMANVDKMFSFGGGLAGNCAIGSFATWLFDPGALTWLDKDPVTGGVTPNGQGGLSVTVYDPNTNLIFVDIPIPSSYQLWKYDLTANQYTAIGPSSGGIDYHQSGVIDPSRKLLYLVGGGQFWKISIATGSTYTKTDIAGSVSGCSTWVNGTYPGVAFDLKQNLIIGWNGGNTVYAFNPDTNVCTPITYSGGPSSTPQTNGTDGRFAYFPLLNVFALVNDWAQNAVTLRLTNSPTSFTLTSPNTGTFPFTVGLAFKKGDVPSAASLSLTNQQVIVKSSWLDGSVKHAVASGRVALTANVATTVNVLAQAGSGGTNKTCTDIQTAAPTASVQLGAIGTVTLTSLLASPFRTWISGPEMVECHYKAQVGSDPLLVVWYHVRLYADNRVWVRAIVQNGYVDVTNADKSYVPTVIIGGTTVYTNGGSALSNPAHTRWNVDGWIGGDPQITPAHDTVYLEASKLLPNYMNQTPSAAALNGLAQTYTPMSQGGWTTNMGDTGFQRQIGLLPLWDSLYATSLADSRAYNSVLTNAQTINSYAIVWNDSATGVTLRPTDRPTWTVSGAGGGGATNWGAGSLSWDVAHHGSAGYVAYLITGDYYYLEDMADQSSNCYLFDGSSHGSGVNRDMFGIVQSRGEAWCFRTVSEYVAVAPTGDTVANDYRTWLTNATITFNNVAQQGGMNQLGFMLGYEIGSNAYGAGILAPWQEDFFTQSLGMGTDIEPLADMTNWHALETYNDLAPAGRLGPNGSANYCFTDAAQYNLKVTNNIGDPPTSWDQTWGLVWTRNMGSPNTACANTLHGGSGSDPANAATGYWGNLMPAEAYAADHGAPGAAAAWIRLTGATNWTTVLNSGFADTPMWGIIPRSAQVATNPPAPNVTMFVGLQQNSGSVKVN